MTRPSALRCGLLLSLFAVGGPAFTADGDREDLGSITIMTFNVENLFDNEDDAGKVDETFLAIEDKQAQRHIDACNAIPVDRWRDQCLYWDWSDAAIQRKLTVVADAIRQVDGGRGPDIVALQEVENIRILERLREEHLTGLGYRAPILIEGHDARGIDVAFLTRLETEGAPKLHTIEFEDVDAERIADTRGILETTFVLPDGALLTGYSVHFPAPFHPTVMREAAYAKLNALRTALPADRAVFAAGDFNTTSAEDREERMLERLARPHWTVTHDYCRGCPGTSYYAPTDEWSFLDTILWAPAAERGKKTTWRLRTGSVSIANLSAAQVAENGTPARFELDTDNGVSDHWPLIISIESN